MGGEMFEELQAISRGMGKITSMQFRMALAAMAEIATNASEQYTRILLAIEAQNTNIEAIYLQINELKAQISTCEKCEDRVIVQQIRKNLFFRLGALITEHPRAMKVGLSIIGGMVIVIFALWMLPEAKQVALDFSHFPTVGVSVMGR